MRPSQLTTVLDREFLSAREGHHTPVMLWGPPGVGKSQMVAQIAERHGVQVIDIRLSQMEPSDLRGIPFRTQELVEWAVPAILPDARRHGDFGILFLDEITSAPPSVSAAAYQLILDRRLGAYQVPKGWAIFEGGNAQGGGGDIYDAVCVAVPVSVSVSVCLCAVCKCQWLCLSACECVCVRARLAVCPYGRLVASLSLFEPATVCACACVRS